MIKDFLEKKFNQKNELLPTYMLILMSLYVIWQMGIIWIDANNSVIASSINNNPYFISNLSLLCVLVSVVSIILFTFFPKLAYKSCKISTYISIITSIVLLTNCLNEICLYVLISSCSIMSLSTLVIYLFTYNSINIKKQVFIEMIGVSLISILLHSDINIPTIFYNIISILLLLLFSIGLHKISNVEIKFSKTIEKKEDNVALYIGIIVLLIIFNTISVFGSSVVNQFTNGNIIFYSGSLLGSVLYYVLNKININKEHIPEIYIAIFLLSLAFFYVHNTLYISILLMGMSNSFFFILPYYCNLVYKNTLSKCMYIIYNIIGILQVFLLDFLLNITHNNIDVLITIYLFSSILSICILFIINNKISDKMEEIVSFETINNLFKDLTNSEKNVAELLIRNYSNNDIAKELNLSTNTIKFHTKNIFRKTNTSNKKELINKITF